MPGVGGVHAVAGGQLAGPIRQPGKEILAGLRLVRITGAQGLAQPEPCAGGCVSPMAGGRGKRQFVVDPEVSANLGGVEHSLAINSGPSQFQQRAHQSHPVRRRQF